MNTKDHKVTISWLFHNLSIAVWGTFITLFIGAFLGGVTFGRTTFVSELIGKPALSPPPQLSAEKVNQRADQLIEGHNQNIKSMYDAIAQEEKEAGKSPYSTEAGPHIDSAKRLKETLSLENQRFEQQIKLLRELQR